MGKVVYAMRQLIVLCLLTLEVINSAKISNNTGLKGLKDLLNDGSPKPDNVDVLPDAVNTEPDEQESDGEEPLVNITPKKSKSGGKAKKDKGHFLDEFPGSFSEDSHYNDESKKDKTSSEVLSEQGIQYQPSENEHTPEDEDPVHSVSIADLVLNFRKAKLLKSRSGSNNTRHRHHHHHHSKPSSRSKISEKHGEPNDSRGRSGDRREMGGGMYQHPDGYIVEEGADFGHEFYPNNNVLSIVHRSVMPAHVIPQRVGCLQCNPAPMALRKNMNPPINYFYNTLPGR